MRISASNTHEGVRIKLESYWRPTKFKYGDDHLGEIVLIDALSLSDSQKGRKREEKERSF